MNMDTRLLAYAKQNGHATVGSLVKIPTMDAPVAPSLWNANFYGTRKQIRRMWKKFHRDDYRSSMVVPF